ncbi:MAG TPA: hypothetical protein DCG57_09080 [Candidatus Riflebacteria bacterium]|jgi:hypothetical protein|nr:hypothetical protein [Candidatus Riflebacteria bacterium]
MKTLGSAAKKAGFLPVIMGKAVAVAGIVLSIAVFFLAAWLYRLPERLVLAQAQQNAAGIVSLAAEVAVRPSQQIRNSLALMARNPEVRKLQNTSVVRAWQLGLQNSLSLLLDSYEPLLGHAYEKILMFAHDVDYLKELPQAMVRRFALSAGLLPSLDNSYDEMILLPPARLADKDLDRMYLQTSFAREQTAGIRQFFSDSSELWLAMIYQFEELAGFSRQTLSDIAAVEDFFSAALNDEIFRTIMLKNLDGTVLAATGDVSVNDLSLDARDCKAVKNGSIFFTGPVGYDTRRQRPLWWVAVPVRDENRNPLACLTAFVDSGFLSDAAARISQNADSRLIFADHTGSVIGHADRQVVAKRVNISKTMPPFASATEERNFTSRFVRQDGKFLLQAGKSIRHDNVRHLPDWFVCYEQELGKFTGQNEFLVTVSVILLAAMGMYVLSCCVVRLF